MGTLANGDLRHKRILAHRALEHLQQSRHMEKWEVYIWLQAKLGLNDQQAHIGMFSDGMCDEVIRLCYKAAGLLLENMENWLQTERPWSPGPTPLTPKYL